jgi:hypothetical protein
VRQRTARRPAGTAGVGGPTPDERTAPPSEPGESPSASTPARQGAAELLEAIYAGQPFRTVLRDLGLSSNRVSGLARTDQEWSERLDAALTASHRGDLEHGTNAGYLHGCVYSDCRMHQQVRMGRTVANGNAAADC